MRSRNESLHEGMVIRNLKGNLSNGLWNGDMNWNFVYADRIEEWTLHFIPINEETIWSYVMDRSALAPFVLHVKVFCPVAWAK